MIYKWEVDIRYKVEVREMTVFKAANENELSELIDRFTEDRSLDTILNAGDCHHSISQDPEWDICNVYDARRTKPLGVGDESE